MLLCLSSNPKKSMKRIQAIKALLYIVSLSVPWGVQGAESVSELMKQGEVYDLKFQPTEALTFYLPAEKMEPNNVPLLLCIARQYRHLMADASDASEKMRLGGIGKSYAQRAVTLAPKDSEAYLSVAIGNAKMIPLLGKKAQMEASRDVKTAVDKSISLDCHKDLAWHILGCWNQRLADIGTVKRTLAQMFYGKVPEATNEEAVKCFQEAIKLNPKRPIHFIELGRTYAKMGQTAVARVYIKRGLAMPNIGKDDPAVKQSGRETLATLQ